MELERVDTQQAYKRIREQIITLQLPPGSAIDAQKLAAQLEMADAPVREALKLLAHDDLVTITPRHGIYVTGVSLPDLEQISEMRVPLEVLAARLAAQRAAPDDLTVLEALCVQYAGVSSEDAPRLFDLDHKFHQAIARAAYNRYLARTLEHLFGLSQRLWYLALPSSLGFLPTAVADHLALVDAIRSGEAAGAGDIMARHVEGFYSRVREVLLAKA